MLNYFVCGLCFYCVIISLAIMLTISIGSTTQYALKFEDVVASLLSK